MITRAICDGWNEDVLNGLHAPKDTYKMALYTAEANLDHETRYYTAVGEVLGPGYAPGGIALRNRRVFLEAGEAKLAFDEARWPQATISGVVGALIYNASRQSRAMFVLNFGQRALASVNGPFFVSLPPYLCALAAF